jgi:hypothetical protein
MIRTQNLIYAELGAAISAAAFGDASSEHSTQRMVLLISFLINEAVPSLSLVSKRLFVDGS